jgi:FeS assembly SUF system protein
VKENGEADARPPEERIDITAANSLVLEAQVVEAIKTCFDPEIPVNIYELGLIYGITVDPARGVEVRMTLTSPNCPAAGTLPGEVLEKVKSVPGVKDAKVDVVFDPPWDPSKMSEAARLELGLW